MGKECSPETRTTSRSLSTDGVDKLLEGEGFRHHAFGQRECLQSLRQGGEENSAHVRVMQVQLGEEGLACFTAELVVNEGRVERHELEGRESAGQAGDTVHLGVRCEHSGDATDD